MNAAPKGKIGRLPMAVQEQVNRRLEHGERVRTLVAWLNALPEVQAVLTAEFAGKPIREQNLSDWRKHDHQPWLWRQPALAMAQASPCPRERAGVRRKARNRLIANLTNHFGMHGQRCQWKKPLYQGSRG